MSNYEIRNLEQRIAAIEENLGISDVKTLAEAANEESERRKQADAQAFRTKWAPREFYDKAELDQALTTTMVLFINNLNSPETRTAIERLDDEFRMMTNGQYLGIAGTWIDVEHSWGYWDRSNPRFPIDDDELEGFIEGNDLPVARLPNKDPESSDSTLLVMEEDGPWGELQDWFQENEGKMSY